MFFGLGSIGNRHVKILADKYDFELFAYRTKKGEGSNSLGIKEIYEWSEVKKIQPDVAFITNPTFLHIDTAIKCAKLNMKLFIEKPIGCRLKNLNLLLKEVSRRKLVSYVAYNLRFHPLITFLKEYLKSKKIYHVAIYNSSYLPNWRPHQDHLKSYSAKAQEGGGVILDLSHEFDYIEYLFGNIKSIDGVFGKASNVTRDSEDFMDAAIVAKRAVVNLHQNFLSLNKERIIKIDCRDEFIASNIITAEVTVTDKKASRVKKLDYDINKMYCNQIQYFFDNIDNNKMMNNLLAASSLYKKIIKFKGNKK